VLTSHSMEECEALCGRLAIMSQVCMPVDVCITYESDKSVLWVGVDMGEGEGEGEGEGQYSFYAVVTEVCMPVSLCLGLFG